MSAELIIWQAFGKFGDIFEVCAEENALGLGHCACTTREDQGVNLGLKLALRQLVFRIRNAHVRCSNLDALLDQTCKFVAEGDSWPRNLSGKG